MIFVLFSIDTNFHTMQFGGTNHFTTHVTMFITHTGILKLNRMLHVIICTARYTHNSDKMIVIQQLGHLFGFALLAGGFHRR